MHAGAWGAAMHAGAWGDVMSVAGALARRACGGGGPRPAPLRPKPPPLPWLDTLPTPPPPTPQAAVEELEGSAVGDLPGARLEPLLQEVGPIRYQNMN